MSLVSRFQAGRLAHKLRSASQLEEGELDKVQNELISLGTDAYGALIDQLEDNEARAAALQILDGILSDETLEPFLKTLASEDHASAILIQRLLSNSRSYDPSVLLPLLQDESAPRKHVQNILLSQASRIHPKRIFAILPEVGRDSQAALFKILERVLEEGDNMAVASDLLRLSDHEDWWFRLNVIQVMARSLRQDVQERLVRMLDDKVAQVRLEAVRVLHQQRAEHAVVPLLQLLRDDDLQVQTAAIDAVCDLGTSEIVRPLLDLLGDDKEYVRRAAVEVLNVVATVDAIQDLVRAVHDEDWWVRVRAADALGALGGEKVASAAIPILSDPDASLRRHAVEILVAVPSPGAVPALIGCLEDEDWWVRERTVDALSAAGDKRAVGPLIEMMSREEKAAAICARALGELGDPKAIEPLRALLDGTSEEARECASHALAKLGEAETGESLETRPAGSGASLAAEILGEAYVPGSGASTPPRGTDLGVPPVERIETRPSVLSGGGAGPSPPATPTTPGAPQPTPQPARLDFTDLPAGTTLLERYRVERRIGKGGFGAIYLVRDVAVEEDIVLKVLNPQLSFDDDSLRRFVQELRLTRRVTHKNVIRIFDFLDLGGAHAVSMEYFPGQDLGHLVTAEGRLETERILRIAVQACEGLAAAHAQGVVHRDIKPPNVLVNERDEVKIVDFGLAAAQQHVGSRLTKSGLIIGSPEYMAPEQISGEETDLRADLYSLGVVLYELLSGTKPFVGETPVKVLFQHLEGEAPPLSELVEGIPPGVEKIVKSAMAREPKDRPASADELKTLIAKELEAFSASSE